MVIEAFIILQSPHVLAIIMTNPSVYKKEIKLNKKKRNKVKGGVGT